MSDDIIYNDALVTITAKTILFKHCSLTGNDRPVDFSCIEKVVPKVPNLWNGKWRNMGSGDFKTWLPYDAERSKRDTIFVAHIRGKWWRIGFTVEDSRAVKAILQSKGLIG